MCVEICILTADGGHKSDAFCEIDTTEKLAAIIGGHKLVKNPVWDSLVIGDCCLCQVDVLATAAKAGYDCTRDEAGFLYEWREKELPPGGA